MNKQAMSTETPQTSPKLRRDVIVAFCCGGLVASMVGLSFAAVPFYSWFCRTTGYGGTTQVAKAAPAQTSDRTITVRFNSNVAAGLPWRFDPERRTIDVKLGQVVTVYYAVTNEAARVTAGQAGYNVSPSTTGAYFEKINCFCFTEQTMKPGEKRDMAVVFYVDPKLADDAELDSVKLITLSYTFYPVRVPDQAAAEGETTGKVRPYLEATKRRGPSSGRANVEKTTMADAAHAKPHHDYHLVNPSPWPAVGATSAFITAFGLILWMHHIVAYAPIILGVGGIGVAYTMIGWWRDVIYEAEVEHDHTRVVQISHRYGMILFIASEVMFFVAWFWAYFNTALFPAELKDVARTAFLGGVWPPKDIHTFDPWHLPLLNTLILLTSGTTVTWAHHALLENNRKGLIWGLICTIALGLTFSCVQAYEYAHAAFHYSGNIYGATFFMATGFHGAHVIIGSIFLIVCLFRAIAGQFTPTQHLGFEFAAWYWHFVDVVWLFLFACIYVWGSGVPLPE